MTNQNNLINERCLLEGNSYGSKERTPAQNFIILFIKELKGKKRKYHEALTNIDNHQGTVRARV